MGKPKAAAAASASVSMRPAHSVSIDAPKKSGQPSHIEAWKQRGGEARRTASQEAHPEQVWQRGPVVRRVDPEPVALELTQHVRERLLQMPLTTHRVHARGLEASSQPELLLQADLDPAGALTGRQSVRHEEKVEVGVHDGERKQAERRGHAGERPRHDSPSGVARSDRPIVREAHRDVLADGVVDLQVHRPRAQSRSWSPVQLLESVGHLSSEIPSTRPAQSCEEKLQPSPIGGNPAAMPHRTRLLAIARPATGGRRRRR
jgi:hypothetical protein